MLDKSLVDETIEVMEATAFQRDYYVEMALGGLFASIILKTQCQQKDVLIESFERNSPKHVRQQVLKEFNSSQPLKVLSEYVVNISDDPMFSHFNTHLSGNELVRPDYECHFCKSRAERQKRWEENGKFWNLVSLTQDQKSSVKRSNREPVKEVRQSIESVVNSLSGDTCVLLPRGWAGKRVRVSLIDQKP